MKQVKITLLAVCALLAVIVAIQNTEVVDTRLLFVTISMPRALLLIVTLLIGVAFGLLAGMRISRKNATEKKPAA